MAKHREVRTASGPVRGRIEDGVAVFRGIPYAAAPVGPRRFQAPEPVAPWTDVLDAGKPAAICPQLPARLAALMGPIEAPQSEDCLTVTIWAPEDASGAAPVLVWLHGGGYSSGGGALPWYAGDRLARDQGVVVVGVNYRVGALGYLSHPNLAPGNMGLADQVMALRWIRENIGGFGGDAERITLMGQSGGAHSILCMLAMPKARSSVRRAVFLSTPFGMRPLSRPLADAAAEAFASQLGIDPQAPGAREQLQTAPVQRVLAAQLEVMKMTPRPAGDPTPAFGPAATPELPGGREYDDAVRLGAKEIDAILGVTADEMTPFYRQDPRVSALDAESLPHRAAELFGASWTGRIEDARRLQPGCSDLDAFCHAQNVNYFIDGLRDFASSVAASGHKAWIYQFDWRLEGSPLGACHCVELPFVFGTLEAFGQAPMLGGVDAAKAELSARVRGLLGAFVTGQAPAAPSVPAWAPYDPSEEPVLHLGDRVWLGHGLMDRPATAAAGR